MGDCCAARPASGVHRSRVAVVSAPPAPPAEAAVRHEKTEPSKVPLPPSAELRNLGLAALLKLAQGCGIEQAALDDMLDSDSPKEGVCTLIRRSTAEAELRSELLPLRLVALQRRALQEGVSEAPIDDAIDSEDPKAALIALIVTAAADAARNTGAVAAAEAEAQAQQHSQRLAAELEGMRMGALQRRAGAAGVSEDALDDALDAASSDGGDPKSLVIQLIVKQELELIGSSSAAPPEEGVPPLTAGRPACSPAAASMPAPPAQRSSSPPPEQQQGAQAAAATDHLLRAELEVLPLRELARRARSMGLEEDTLLGALYSEQQGAGPRAALLAALLEHVLLARRQQELAAAALPLRQLARRACEAGAAEDAVLDAMDSDAPRQGLAQLLLSQALVNGADARTPPPQGNGSSSGMISHVGAVSLRHNLPGQAPAPAPERGTALACAPVPLSRGKKADTRHAMISYSWDQQALVITARQGLEQRGISCWMDISGGMSRDIYASMAEGVENASVVVCFISQEYQDSENCQLELKFARQTGVPIVPVKVQADWRASGWLGIVIAGALWTALDANAMDSSIDAIAEAVRKAAGTVGRGDQALAASSMLQSGDQEQGASQRRGSDHDHDEVVAELARLREQLERSKQPSSQAGEAAFDPDAPAQLSLDVPQLPSDFRESSAIVSLRQLLLTGRDGGPAVSQVGFYGHGGIGIIFPRTSPQSFHVFDCVFLSISFFSLILFVLSLLTSYIKPAGKTITGAALVRDMQVRRHYHQICWIPLGQSPVISKLQQSCIQQLTGKDVPLNSSEEVRQEILRKAMLGKRVLLVLDDLWDEAHRPHFDLVDRTQSSCVLISTRVRGLLAGGESLQITVPSEADAIRILLAAAGLPSDTRPPSAASAIVRDCAYLPLSLAIAGKLIRELELGLAEWDGLSAVLQEELRAGEHSSKEHAVIKTSLSKLKGSRRDQKGARALLQVLGLVPEDTTIDPYTLHMLFCAVWPVIATSTDSPEDIGNSVTVTHIRKFLRVLISHSLVLVSAPFPSFVWHVLTEILICHACSCQELLRMETARQGTIDRPSLHDIVGDFSNSLFNPTQHRDAHRRIVQIFIDQRPADFFGSKKWDQGLVLQDATTRYVCNEVQHHIQHCIKETAQGVPSDPVVLSWVDHGPQDPISNSTARLLGDAALGTAAEQAQEKGHLWQAACRWGAATHAQLAIHGRNDRLIECAKNCLSCLWSIPPEDPGSSQEDRLILELRLASQIAMHQVPEVVEFIKPRLPTLLATKTANRMPLFKWLLTWTTSVFDVMWYDYAATCKALIKCTHVLVDGVLDAPDELIKEECATLLLGKIGYWVDCFCNDPDFSWDMFDAGPSIEPRHRGALVRLGLETYSFDRWHQTCSLAALDMVISGNAGCSVLFGHHGDLHAGHQAFDLVFKALKQCAEAKGTARELGNDKLGELMMLRGPVFIWTLLLGRQAEVVAHANSLGLNHANVEPFILEQMSNGVTSDFLRPVGSTVRDVHMFSAETFIWEIKLGLALCGDDEGLDESLLSTLPTPTELAKFGVTGADGGLQSLLFSSCSLAMLVCLRLGDLDRCMDFARAITGAPDLQTAFRHGIENSRFNVALAFLVQGQVLSAQRRVAEAEAAYEAGLSIACTHQLRILQLLLLSELKRLLDDATSESRVTSPISSSSIHSRGSRTCEQVAQQVADLMHTMISAPEELTSWMLEHGRLTGVWARTAVDRHLPELALDHPQQMPSADSGVAEVRGATPTHDKPQRKLTLLVESPTLFAGKRKCVVEASGVGELADSLREQIGLSCDIDIVMYDDEFEEDVVVHELSFIEGDRAKVAVVECDGGSGGGGLRPT
jgi:hypothetical protein